MIEVQEVLTADQFEIVSIKQKELRGKIIQIPNAQTV